MKFGALFERFERVAFRLEARDHYDVEDERHELAAFLKVTDLARRSPASDQWLALVAAGTAAGQVFERVRLVSEPLTDHTRFEFAGYPDNIAAGERVWVLPRARLQEADHRWASEDFSIFDERLVVLLNYDDEGRFL